MSEVEPSITCPTCGKTSYHPEDIKQRFCGACHNWHDLIALEARACGDHALCCEIAREVQEHK
jgi:coenzyme F420-reducing hydrogenase alpha subunit